MLPYRSGRISGAVSAGGYRVEPDGCYAEVRGQRRKEAEARRKGIQRLPGEVDNGGGRKIPKTR